MQREVAIILKVKNAAQVKKELKDVFNRGTTTAVSTYNRAITKTDKKQLKVSKSAKKAGHGVKGFGNILMGSVASLYAYNRAFTSTMQLMDKGASLERVGEAFKKTVGSLEVALPALRKATRGAVADFNLMKTANRAVIEGINPEKLGSFFKMASVASEKLNINRADAINMVTRAITRQDMASMKGLGIIPKTNKALNIQMGILSKIGKIAAPAMRIQKMHSYVMGELASKYGAFNALFTDNLLLINRSKTAWTNLKASIGSALIQAFKPLLMVIPSALNSMRDFLNTISTNKSLGTFTNHLLSFGAALASIAAATSGLKLFKLMGSFFGFNSIIKIGVATLVGYAFGIKDIGKALSTAFSIGKVFFALIQSYNSKTGLSNIAKKDADSLGSLYGVVLQLARGFKIVQAMAQGALAGITGGLSMLSPLFGSMGSMVKEMFQNLRDGKPIAQSTLDSFREASESAFRKITKVGIAIGGLILAFKTFGVVSSVVMGTFSLGKAIAGMTLFTSKIIFAIAKMTALAAASTAAWVAANPVAALGIAAVGGAAYVTHSAMTSTASQNTTPVSQQGMAGNAPTVAPQNSFLSPEDETGTKQNKLLQKVVDLLEKGDSREDRKENTYQGNSFNSSGGVFEGI